ncbi:MAG: hypothetical protein COA57_02340 [Flavobacteriales bacterium]|nr:heavy-metal-associated domain-containing protein [Bacteroidales bacterium AH-315-I05]PCJ89353.1 MAG: hypothetical protein COA57_02340 [Flavobacteriales bacterium]
MIKKLLLSTVLVLIFIAMGNLLCAQSSKPNKPLENQQITRTITLQFEGAVTSEQCAALERIIKTKEGIISSRTDYAAKKCTVEYDETINTKDILGLFNSMDIKAASISTTK